MRSVGTSFVQYANLNHIGILTSNTTSAVNFYVKVLNFTDETHLRHQLPYPGAFVRGGDVQLHLMELLSNNSTENTALTSYPGRDRHVAITVHNLGVLKEKLDAHGVSYSASVSGRQAVFFRDPDGNALEFVQQPGASCSKGSKVVCMWRPLTVLGESFSAMNKGNWSRPWPAGRSNP
jgi:glyoxylase I family protein